MTERLTSLSEESQQKLIRQIAESLENEEPLVVGRIRRGKDGLIYVGSQLTVLYIAAGFVNREIQTNNDSADSIGINHSYLKTLYTYSRNEGFINPIYAPSTRMNLHSLEDVSSFSQTALEVYKEFGLLGLKDRKCFEDIAKKIWSKN